MIYGTHPSDEGGTTLLCEYDEQQGVYTVIEKTVIINGKKVRTNGTPEECNAMEELN